MKDISSTGTIPGTPAAPPANAAHAEALNVNIHTPHQTAPTGALTSATTPHHNAPTGATITTPHPHGDKENGVLKQLHKDVQKIEQDLTRLTTMHEGGAPAGVVLHCGDQHCAPNAVAHAGADSKAKADHSAHATPTAHGVAVHSVTTPHVHGPGATVITGP